MTHVAGAAPGGDGERHVDMECKLCPTYGGMGD